MQPASLVRCRRPSTPTARYDGRKVAQIHHCATNVSGTHTTRPACEKSVPRETVDRSIFHRASLNLSTQQQEPNRNYASTMVCQPWYVCRQVSAPHLSDRATARLAKIGRSSAPSAFGLIPRAFTPTHCCSKGSKAAAAAVSPHGTGCFRCCSLRPM